MDSASWSAGGKPVPFLPIITVGWSGNVYGPALTSADKHPDVEIPVERSNGLVLRLCGEEDSLWTSCPMARAAKARRDQKGGGAETVLLAKKDAGHFGVGPPLDMGKEVPSMITMFGGSSRVGEHRLNGSHAADASERGRSATRNAVDALDWRSLGRQRPRWWSNCRRQLFSIAAA